MFQFGFGLHIELEICFAFEMNRVEFGLICTLMVMSTLNMKLNRINQNSHVVFHCVFMISI